MRVNAQCIGQRTYALFLDPFHMPLNYVDVFCYTHAVISEVVKIKATFTMGHFWPTCNT